MSSKMHIAMVGTSAPSHIYPSLSLIRELVRRGHRVNYAVGDRFADLVAPTGADVLTHPSTLPGAGGPEASWPDDPIAGMRLFLDEGIAVLPALLDRFAADRPDLVLHDIGGLAGPVLAARLGVAAVQLSPPFVAWEGYEHDMAGTVAAFRAAPGAAGYYATFAAWLAEHGVDRTPDEVLSRPERGLVLVPRVLQPMADRVSPRFQFVGPCLDPERLAAGGWEPPAGGAPVLYVSFGTAFTDQVPVYRAVIEAFGGSAWRVVLAIGQRVDPAELPPAPPNVEVHRSAPQLAVLEHASAFVTHAGMGSTMEALWFGVPTIALPQGYDQDANAARLTELGVGRQLATAEVTPASLRAAVEALAADPDVRSRLDALRDELRVRGGAGAAADAVEAAG
jgi:MGT family glycosyltransferase